LAARPAASASALPHAHPSYAFDVADRTQVAGYADHVVVGSVDTPGTTNTNNDAAPPRTTYSVRVAQVMKGSLKQGAEVAIVQHGVDLSGKKRQLLDGVASVAADNTYVFAVKEDDQGTLTLLSGPHSPQLVSDAAGRLSAQGIQDWQNAVTISGGQTRCPRKGNSAPHGQAEHARCPSEVASQVHQLRAKFDRTQR
jgi:hypothetical protein